MLYFILGMIVSLIILYVFRQRLIIQYINEIQENKLARREIEKVTAKNKIEFENLMDEIRREYIGK
jgi:hypothetical protein